MDLHIKSTNYDEPTCLELLARCDVVVSVHGLDSEQEHVDVGGRDISLRDAICRSLEKLGFDARVVERGGHAGVSPENICNRGRGGAGVQLEIARALRDTLIASSGDRETFACAVRQAIDNALKL